jgi:hypothetical protein
MKRRHQQIITLAVDIDLARCPPPEQWDWNEITGQLDGAANVKVLAAGPVEKLALPQGFALAMAVLQSPEYPRLEPEAKDEADALIALGQARL